MKTLNSLFRLAIISMLFNSPIFSQTLIYPKLPTDIINGVHFVNENEIILINSAGSIYKSYDGGYNWELKKHFQGESLVSIEFIDQNTGFILPQKKPSIAAIGIIYTNNAGENWEVQPLDISSIHDFLPLNENISLKSTWAGQIQRLNNFYNNWDTVYSFPTFTVFDIEFGNYEVSYGYISEFEKLSSDEIITLGINYSAFENNIIDDSLSFLLKSNNSGLTWDTLWIGLNSFIKDISFTNSNNGWMCDDETIYNTIDGGKTWNIVNTNLKGIDNLYTISSNELYCTIDYGNKILKTMDFGINWETIEISDRINGGLNFFDENIGFLFGNQLVKTNNGCSSFEVLHHPIDDYLNDLLFTSKKVGFAAGYNGVYATEDGGLSWNQKLSAPNSNSGKLSISLNETIWYVKYDSIYKSSDFGEYWNRVELSTKSQLYSGITFYDSNLGIIYSVAEENIPGSKIYSPKYNYITTDGGINWNPVLIDSIFNDIDFQKVEFTDPEHLFAIGQNGLWLSRDTAKTWENLYNTDYFYTGYSFDFYDSLAGILSFGYSESLITIDGGRTWKKFDKPIGLGINDCAIIGPNYDNEFIRAIEAGDNGILILYYFSYEGELISSRQLTTYTNSSLTTIEINEEDLFPNVWIGSENFNILYREYEKLPTNIELVQYSTPTQFSLSQNFPNPFNPTTTIEYTIPTAVKSENAKVKIIVYDVLGKGVATLVNETKQPGIYLATFDASNLASGIYYYRLSVDDFVQTKKMIFLK